MLKIEQRNKNGNKRIEKKLCIHSVKRHTHTHTPKNNDKEYSFSPPFWGRLKSVFVPRLTANVLQMDKNVDFTWLYIQLSETSTWLIVSVSLLYFHKRLRTVLYST